ncbi:tRNA 4-thiouridine(8) synthase ThiI [Candidatus Gracilibacteria bacterium]|nr:tRNA 4-thiouridine(8) synthase ThiI [Candidatus Gracilibacteria bacterium]
MKIIIKPFSEIMIKSKFVKKQYLKNLQKNILRNLKELELKIEVVVFNDKLEVNYNSENENDKKEIIKKLKFTIGIENFIDVQDFQIEDDFLKDENPKRVFDFVFQKAKDFYLDKIKNKSFCVRVKRSGIHNFTSIDLEKYIGGGLKKFGENANVKLKNPDLEIKIEVKDKKIFLVKEKYQGIGGYPVGTQDKVLSLISGGFDSGVSTFKMMKRGCKIDFLFFNLGGSAHELGVKQVSRYIWKNFGMGYDSRFITIPFENVIKELLEKVDSRFRGILLKRYFLKIADKLAKKHGYLAIVKGDSLGQVSSQTLKNMNVIDKASDTLVLRPLIGDDKQEIISITKKIGTHDFACNMPEYCGVISDKPATGASLEQILEQEEKIDEKILDEAIENGKIEFLKKIFAENLEGKQEIEISYLPAGNEVVIDIRDEEKIKKNPIHLENTEILQIPFFNINNEFGKLDQSKTYLFYCDEGILSKLHGLYLKEKGFKNIKIFRFLKKGCEVKSGE